MNYLVVQINKVSQNKDSHNSSQWVIEEFKRTDMFVNVEGKPKDLCKKLKDLHFLDTCDMRKISVSSMDKDIIEVRTRNTLKPLLRLEVARWRS